MGRGQSLRVTACAVVAGALVAGAGCTADEDKKADPAMSPEARAYLSSALTFMEKNALHHRTIDWKRLRRTAYTQAREARQPADTYSAIYSALNSLGDGHSFLWDPKKTEAAYGPSPKVIEGLEGRSMGDHIGYVSIPSVTGTEKTLRRYVRQGRRAVAKADRGRACGWVVDLRDNRGGIMWPMLAVVGRILGDGRVGMFVDAKGEKTAWTIENGNPTNEGYDWGASEPVAHDDAPVAVLTGPDTGSSGEAVLVAFRGRPETRSFGEPTSGVPTGNTLRRLPDGALLGVTTVRDADRTGRTYDAAIPPDQDVLVPLIRGEGHEDRALTAAKNWLLKRPACR
ncbi:S41 family peptidase [Streptomyces cucumeris]|uniref:S41 family peptidase n=1 Tax=Streptomyces cucumeris TaxID=2962890 RepID=UPI003D728448